MANRAPPPADPAAAEAIGEIRGQLREIIHMSNNRAQREEATSAILIALKDVPDRLSKIETRLETLETDRTVRNTERGVIFAILRSPTFGWLAGFVATAWAYLTGRLHL